MDGWADIKRGAEYANVSSRTFRGFLKKGLKHSRPNAKVVLIRYADIDEYLESFKVRAEARKKRVDVIVGNVLKEFGR